MQHLPFDKPGQFYKGNLHTHSTLSDGHLEPQEVCQLYQDAGYDFIALTDHFLEHYQYPLADTRPFRNDQFTTIIGAELHAGQTEHGRLWHILGVGLPLDFAQPAEDETGPQIAARALQAGAFVAAAHPYWYRLTEADVLSLGAVDAIETYNGTSEDHNDGADSWYMLDNLLERGHRYFACATDDAHFNPARADACIGWVQVKSSENTPEALLAALKAGHFYSSTGPSIFDVQFADNTVQIRCSPASRIFVTGSSYTARTAFGNGITQAEIELGNFNSPFCRITVRDAHGKKAWTNPIWF